MTQDEARTALIARIHDEGCPCDEKWDDCNAWHDAADEVDNILSAPPEVLAAAIGGYVQEVEVSFLGQPIKPQRVIVLPPREVSRGE